MGPNVSMHEESREQLIPPIGPFSIVYPSRLSRRLLKPSAVCCNIKDDFEIIKWAECNRGGLDTTGVILKLTETLQTALADLFPFGLCGRHLAALPKLLVLTSH